MSFKRYTSKRILFLVLLELALLIFSALINNLKFLVFASLVIFIFNIIKINGEKENKISFATIFLSLSFVLHFGNLVLVRLFAYPNTFLDLDKRLVVNAIVFTDLCHIAFSTAASVHSNDAVKDGIKLFQLDDRTFFRVAVLSTTIGVIPKVYIDLSQVGNQLLNGYEESWSLVTQYGIKSILAQFFYVGVLMLIFALKDRKWTARFIIVCVSLLEVYSMLSGGRIYAIAYIISMIYVYFVCVEKFRIKYLVIGFLIIYILSSILSSIAVIRTLGTFSFEVLFNNMLDSFGEVNPIFKILVELGSTMKTVVIDFKDIPSNNPYGLGASYIETLFSIIPGSEGTLTDANHLTFIYNFQNYSWLGGSWIGESYYNFSWLGFIFCYIWGVVLGRYEKILVNAEKNNDYFSATICLTFIYYIVVYTRDYFARFATAIQVCAVILVISWILHSVFFGGRRS